MTELIFGATAATDGRVKILVSCVNFWEINANCNYHTPQKITIIVQHTTGVEI